MVISQKVAIIGGCTAGGLIIVIIIVMYIICNKRRRKREPILPVCNTSAVSSVDPRPYQPEMTLPNLVSNGLWMGSPMINDLNSSANRRPSVRHGHVNYSATNQRGFVQRASSETRLPLGRFDVYALGVNQPKFYQSQLLSQFPQQHIISNHNDGYSCDVFPRAEKRSIHRQNTGRENSKIGLYVDSRFPLNNHRRMKRSLSDVAAFSRKSNNFDRTQSSVKCQADKKKQPRSGSTSTKLEKSSINNQHFNAKYLVYDHKRRDVTATEHCSTNSPQHLTGIDNANFTLSDENMFSVEMQSAKKLFPSVASLATDSMKILANNKTDDQKETRCFGNKNDNFSFKISKCSAQVKMETSKSESRKNLKRNHTSSVDNLTETARNNCQVYTSSNRTQNTALQQSCYVSCSDVNISRSIESDIDTNSNKTYLADADAAAEAVLAAVIEETSQGKNTSHVHEVATRNPTYCGHRFSESESVGDETETGNQISTMRQAFEFLDNYHSDEEGLSIKGLSKRHAITTEIADKSNMLY